MPKISLKWIRSFAWPVAVLITGLIFTFGIWLRANEDSSQRLGNLFEYRVDEITHKIDSRLQAYEQILEDLAGLVRLHPGITQAEFRDYVDRLELATRFPGTQGIGYLRYVEAPDLNEFLASQHKTNPDYFF